LGSLQYPSKEFAFCDLELEFLIEVDSEFISIYKANRSAYYYSGFDATNHLKRCIPEAFRLCFSDFEKVDFNDKKFQETVSYYGGYKNVPDSLKFDFPLYTQHLNDGFYSTYEELKANTPTLRTVIPVAEMIERKGDSWKGSYNLVPDYNKLRIKEKDYLYMVYKGEVYLREQGEYFKGFIEGYQLYFHTYGFPNYDKVGLNTALFGLIGAAISTSKANKIAREEKLELRIDPMTGAILDIKYVE